MLKSKISVKIIALVAICSIAFGGVFVYARYNPYNASVVKEQLVSEGVPISDAAIDNNALNVKFKSNGNKQITPEDIISLRNIRNYARLNKDKGKFKGLNITINGTGDNNIIYDGGIIDLNTEIDESTLTNTPVDDVKANDLLTSEFPVNNYFSFKSNIKKCDIGGKEAIIDVDWHGSNILECNTITKQVILAIVNLNKKSNTNISQFTLTIKNPSNSIVILLSADLLYRDFIWYQSPDLNGNSWTHNPAPLQKN